MSWNDDFRFPLGYFVCQEWTTTEKSVKLDKWKSVDFEESEFGDYLNQIELQMCELFEASTTTPFQHYGFVGDAAAFGHALRTLGWLDMVEDFKVENENQQFSAECWVLMLFEKRFSYWSYGSPLVDEFGNWVDLDDESIHQSMQNVLQLSMKIKVTYLHMRGIEFHHYWNYVRMFEDRVRTPDGPQHETDAYSGDSW
jgi:hypothetical protein